MSEAMREKCLKAVEDEPSFPGEMPEGFRKTFEQIPLDEALRIIVALTKSGIRQRILALPESPSPKDAGRVELPELDVTGYSIPGIGFLVAGRPSLTQSQALEVIRRCTTPRNDEAEKMREVLAEYGRHKVTCLVGESDVPDEECTCGLQAALSTPTQQKGGGE